jgi:hypothetical protein
MKALLTALLACCTAVGGGVAAASRGDTPAQTPADSAEGFWFATRPDGINVKWAILDGGESWGIYEAQGTILGAFHGHTHAANGALHGSGLAFDIPSNTLGATTFTGSYIPGQAISLTTAFGATVFGRYVPGYDQPARLAELAGPYAGDGLSSRSPVIGMALRVAPDGAFVMTSPAGCAASGRATPRPGGKAVFDVQLRFAGQACPFGDGASATGIAHVSTASGELFMLAMNAAKTDGWLYLGARTRE